MDKVTWASYFVDMAPFKYSKGELIGSGAYGKVY